MAENQPDGAPVAPDVAPQPRANPVDLVSFIAGNAASRREFNDGRLEYFAAQLQIENFPEARQARIDAIINAWSIRERSRPNVMNETAERLARLQAQLEHAGEQISQLSALQSKPRVELPRINLPTLEISNTSEEYKFDAFKRKFTAFAIRAQLKDALKEDVDPTKISDDDNRRLFSYLMSALSGIPLTTILDYERDEDGVAAWKALIARFVTRTATTINQLYGKIDQLRINGAEDPAPMIEMFNSLLKSLVERGQDISSDYEKRMLLKMIEFNPLYESVYEAATTFSSGTNATELRVSISEKYKRTVTSQNLERRFQGGMFDKRRNGSKNENGSKAIMEKLSKRPRITEKSDAPPGWKFGHDDCTKCGTRKNDKHNEDTCTTPVHRRMWNRTSGRNKAKRFSEYKGIMKNNGRESANAVLPSGSVHDVPPDPYSISGYIVDSGATSHFASIHDVVPGTFVQKKIEFDGVNEGKGETIGTGDVLIRCTDTRGEMIEIMLYNVYITEKGTRLLSIPRLVERNNEILFDFDFRTRLMTIKEGDMVVKIPIVFDHHYLIATSFSVDDPWLVHRRKAHFGRAANCDSCVRAKSKKRRSHGSFEDERNKSKPGEVWHVDVKDLITRSKQGSRYVLRFVDIVTGYFHSEFMVNNDDESTTSALRRFLERCEQVNIKVQKVHGDNQFGSVNIRGLLEEHAITISLTAPHSSTQNAICERSLRTTSEAVRAMLLDQNLSSDFWEYAWNHADYVYNRLVNKRTGKLPIAMLFGDDDYDSPTNFPVFGCRAYVLDPNNRKNSLDLTKECRLLQVDDHRYMVMDCYGRITWTNTAHFDESRQNKEGVKRVSFVEDKSGTPSDTSKSENDSAPPTTWIYDGNPPTTWKSLRASGKLDFWKEPLRKEFEGILERKTWTIVDRKEADGTQVITTRPVLTTKYDAEMNPTIKKARIVAHGHKQVYGVNYLESSSFPVRIENIRTLLSVCAAKQWHVKQIDINQAYLQADIDVPIFIELPDVFNDIMNTKIDAERNVCRLNKSLYGLKQAGKCWSDEYSLFFVNDLGLTQSKMEPGIFFNDDMILAIYVDDIVIGSADDGHITRFIDAINEKYGCKHPSHFTLLGIRTVINETAIDLDQPGYVAKLIEQYEVKPKSGSLSTPLTVTTQVRESPNLTSSEHSSYRSLVGALSWLANATRPDISFPVSVLSQKLVTPTKQDFANGIRVLKYLWSGGPRKICYSSHDAIHITAYVDSDWANDISRKSRSGYVVLVNNAPVSWASKLQPVIALSSTEAEFIAIAYVSQEVMFIKQLLEEIGIDIKDAPVVYTDSEPSLKLLKNPTGHQRTKHIDIRYRFTRDLYAAGTIDYQHVSSESNIADMFTKQLPLADHNRHVDALLLGDSSSSRQKNETAC